MTVLHVLHSLDSGVKAPNSDQRRTCYRYREQTSVTVTKNELRPALAEERKRFVDTVGPTEEEFDRVVLRGGENRAGARERPQVGERRGHSSEHFKDLHRNARARFWS